MSKTLKISPEDTRRVIAVLELQGYVKAADGEEWMTTLPGEAVSRSKPPRFTTEKVEQALSALSDRFTEVNRDLKAPYKIAEAVAFGDFLKGRLRVQPAEVGVRIVPRDPHKVDLKSATEREAQRESSRKPRGNGGIVQIRPFE